MINTNNKIRNAFYILHSTVCLARVRTCGTNQRTSCEQTDFRQKSRKLVAISQTRTNLSKTRF